MTAHIWPLLQPVDQEKLTAPMSHFTHSQRRLRRVKKIKAKWPGDRKNQPKDPPTPHGSVLKTQKRDLFCAHNFFASGLFPLPFR
jgi:hypothetical protein